jgi:hypothetical protein
VGGEVKEIVHHFLTESRRSWSGGAVAVEHPRMKPTVVSIDPGSLLSEVASAFAPSFDSDFEAMLVQIELELFPKRHEITPQIEKILRTTIGDSPL